MTKFQTFVIIILLLFGIVILYFWRKDAEYQKCQTKFHMVTKKCKDLYQMKTIYQAK